MPPRKQVRFKDGRITMVRWKKIMVRRFLRGEEDAFQLTIGDEHRKPVATIEEAVEPLAEKSLAAMMVRGFSREVVVQEDLPELFPGFWHQSGTRDDNARRSKNRRRKPIPRRR